MCPARAAALAAWTGVVRGQTEPLRVVPSWCLPTDSLLPGHSPAQAARCAAAGSGSCRRRSRPRELGRCGFCAGGEDGDGGLGGVNAVEHGTADERVGFAEPADQRSRRAGIFTRIRDQAKSASTLRRR